MHDSFQIFSEYGKLIFTPFVSFMAALFGLFFASRLTEKRDEKKEKIRVEKEAIYIAILVTAHLDKVITACLQVAYDRGTPDPNPPSGFDEVLITSTSTPVFDPLQIESDWRVLPTKLMQGILELPHKIERINSRLDSISDDDWPDDRGEFFETRQYLYADLGRETGQLMVDLRNHAGIPLSLEHERRSRNELFIERTQQIDELQRQRAEGHRTNR